MSSRNNVRCTARFFSLLMTEVCNQMVSLDGLWVATENSCASVFSRRRTRMRDFAS